MHIESLKRSCIDHVKFHQPISAETLANASTSLPAEWFSSTEETTTKTTTTAVPDITTDELKKSNVFTPELLDSLSSKGCLNDCNGNGICLKGTQSDTSRIISLKTKRMIFTKRILVCPERKGVKKYVYTNLTVINRLQQ